MLSSSVSEDLFFNSSNTASNQTIFTEFPVLHSRGGYIPKCYMYTSDPMCVGPFTALPWIQMPSNILMSSNIIVHSLMGKWKVCVSGLHLSSRETTSLESTSKQLIFATLEKPARSKYDIISAIGPAWWWEWSLNRLPSSYKKYEK